MTIVKFWNAGPTNQLVRFGNWPWLYRFYLSFFHLTPRGPEGMLEGFFWLCVKQLVKYVVKLFIFEFMTIIDIWNMF